MGIFGETFVLTKYNFYDKIFITSPPGLCYLHLEVHAHLGAFCFLGEFYALQRI